MSDERRVPHRGSPKLPTRARVVIQNVQQRSFAQIVGRDVRERESCFRVLESVAIEQQILAPNLHNGSTWSVHMDVQEERAQ